MVVLAVRVHPVIIVADAQIFGGLEVDARAEAEAVVSGVGAVDGEPGRAARKGEALAWHHIGKGVLPHRTAVERHCAALGRDDMFDGNAQTRIKPGPAFRGSNEVECTGTRFGESVMARPSGVQSEQRRQGCAAPQVDVIKRLAREADRVAPIVGLCDPIDTAEDDAPFGRDGVRRICKRTCERQWTVRPAAIGADVNPVTVEARKPRIDGTVTANIANAETGIGISASDIDRTFIAAGKTR